VIVWRTVVVLSTAAALAFAGAASAATVKRAGARSYTVTINGAPQSDLTIARLDFGLGTPARHPTRRALRVTIAGPTGLNYLAAGHLRPPTRTTLTALVALVNRGRPGTEELASVRIRVAGARLTHRPRVREVVGAFARRARGSSIAPSMCTRHPRTLRAGDVGTVLAAGSGFGFSPPAVVAQSFDAACFRPVDPAFEQAVTSFGRCPPCGPPGPVAASAAAIPCPLGVQPAYVCPV
jgi:hypothetical protein